MRIGFCRALDDFFGIKVAADCGADYIEAGFSQLARFDDSKFEFCRNYIKSLNMPVYAANGFLPLDLKVTGDGVDYGALDDYITRGFVNCQKIGVEVVVFGSSKARAVPDGFSFDKAKEQIAFFLREHAGKTGKDYGVKIAIEPLRVAETNIIHTVGEADEMAIMSGSDNVFVLGDLFHMVDGKDAVESISKLKTRFLHAHIAQPYDRVYPSKNDNAELLGLYKRFLGEIEAAGCEHCSVEARADNPFYDTPDALNTLKNL